MMVDFCSSNCQLKNSHFASGADEVLNHGIQPWLIDLSVKTGPSIFFEPQEYVFEDWLGYCSDTLEDLGMVAEHEASDQQA